MYQNKQTQKIPFVPLEKEIDQLGFMEIELIFNQMAEKFWDLSRNLPDENEREFAQQVHDALYDAPVDTN